MTATTGPKPALDHSQEASGRRPGRPEPANLDGRYGEIGIPAVAAALHYAGASKNPAYAPAAPLVPQTELRFVEMAA